MDIYAHANKFVVLGRKGENYTKRVHFDVKDWVEEFGLGSFLVTHQRATDPAGYPVVSRYEDGYVIWDITSADVDVVGMGRVQVTLIIGEQIAKSCIFDTKTLDSLNPTATPPDPWESWVDGVLAATTHYPMIGENGNWFVWQNGAWSDTGVSAKGSTLWEDIEDKPTTFPPSAHTHEMADISGLPAALASKQDTIPDLSDIREGAELGASALQADALNPYRTAEEQGAIDATHATKSELAETDRSLEALWMLNKGQTWDFDTDNDTVYSKSVPSGAKWGSVDSIGGRSVVVNQHVSGISSLVDHDGITTKQEANGKISITNISRTSKYSSGSNRGTLVTSELSDHKIIFIINNADGDTTGVGVIYIVDGTYSNLIQNGTIVTLPHNMDQLMFRIGPQYDFINAHPIGNVLTFNCYIVDLTQWFGTGSEPTTTDDPRMAEVYAYLEQHPEYNAGEIVSGKVDAVEVKNAEQIVFSTAEIPPAIKALDGYGQSHESDVNTVDFANKIYRKTGYYDENGEWVSDAEDIDISDLIPDGFLENMPVESGGAITFKQDGAELAVPVQNTFLVKLSEVN